MKMLTIVVVIVVLSSVILFLYGRGGSGTVITAQIRTIDKGALITEIAPETNWAIVDGETVGEVTLTLNDETIANIATTTPGENSCTELVAKKCVLLADMLGPSVVWFAIVNADERNGNTLLTLDGLVDMKDDGNTGVLKNGWLIPLATPVKRTCNVSTTSLRDFINRYPANLSISIFNLSTDEIDTVKCVTQ